jgi:hypothetical protein
VPIPSPIYAVVAPRALAWNHRAPPQGRRARRRRACCSLISMGEERCRPHLRPRLLARFSCRPELGPSSKTARLSSSSAAGRNRALGQRMERFRPAVPGPCSAAATRSESSHPAPVPPAAPHHESSRPVRIEPARRGRLLHRGGGAGAGEERGAMGRQGARGGGAADGERDDWNHNGPLESKRAPVESKRAVTFYPSVGSQEPYLHLHPIPSIHFISFIVFLLMRSRGERCETVVEPGAALPRLLGELLPVGCGYGSRAPRHAANCRSGGAGRPPGEPRHEPSSQANGDAG